MLTDGTMRSDVSYADEKDQTMIATIQVIFTCVPLFDIFMHLISVFSTQSFLLCNLVVDEI